MKSHSYRQNHKHRTQIDEKLEHLRENIATTKNESNTGTQAQPKQPGVIRKNSNDAMNIIT